MKRIKICAAVCGMALASSGSAEARPDKCKEIATPTARLACYDEQSGRSAAISPPALVAPTAQGATTSADADPDALRQRSDFDSSLAAIVPLRHGYYRLELADGSAYTTTVVAPPPPLGLRVHVRRSPFGTTFLDMAGRKPITVKPVRRQ